MARRPTNGDRTRGEPVSGERVERAGPSPGLVRALFTLAGVAAAGFLAWLASLLDLDATGEFWAAMGLLAAAGAALGLSQLFGGWTKWGFPTLSPGVFLFAFLPTLIVGGWILLARQPEGGWQEERFDGWTDDIGLSGLVDDLATFLPVIPLVIGLVLAFSLDTTGPRTRVVARAPAARDEDARDYHAPATPTREAAMRDRTVAEDVRTREERTGTPVEEAPEHRRTETTTGAAEGDRTVAEDLRTRDEQTDTVPSGARSEREEGRETTRRDIA